MTRIPLLAASLVLAAVLLLRPPSAGASASGVVLSQVYGGGGNAGAAFANDFVELFNGGTAAVDVSGWTIQYATAAGTSWTPTPLAGTIAPGGYLLVGLASGGTAGSALPTPDVSGTTNIAASGGKIALVRDQTPLSCGAAAGSCSAIASVEDLVGYGAAADFEGSGSAPSTSATQADVRAAGGCSDTDDNAADFAAEAPSPRSSASPASSCAAPPPPPPASGTSATADVALDVPPMLSISLARPSLSFGGITPGTAPEPLSEDVTVVGNGLAGYTLDVERSAFAPSDLPLALAATAPAGGQLGAGVAADAFAPIPVSPAPALRIGTTAAPTPAAGDVWATRIGFSSPLANPPAGHYTATVTYTVTAR
jgi:hypothetical protein